MNRIIKNIFSNKNFWFLQTRNKKLCHCEQVWRDLSYCIYHKFQSFILKNYFAVGISGLVIRTYDDVENMSESARPGHKKKYIYNVTLRPCANDFFPAKTNKIIKMMKISCFKSQFLNHYKFN